MFTLGLFVAGIGAAIVFSNTSIKEWRARRYAERGAALARGGNVEAARMACLRALALDRNCLPATRELANLVPGGDVLNILLLRARIADLAPADLGNLVQMASIALLANRPDMAARAIRDLERAEGITARVLKLRTSLALVRGNDAGASVASRELLKHDPQDAVARLNAALAEIRSGVATEATERELKALRSSDAALGALCGLRDLAMNRSDRQGAIEYAEAILKLPQAVFADWLLHANLVSEENPARVDELLTKLTARAGADPRALSSIAGWLRQHGRSEAIEPWIASCEALKHDPTTTQMIRADDLMARGAWTELDALLAAQNWGSMNFIRVAAMARASRARGQNEVFTKRWKEATDPALEKLVTTRMLAELTAGWPEWSEQTDAFLWRASEHGPDYAVWALPELQRRLTERRDTFGLLRVTKAMLRLRPNSDPVRNNLAFYSLLLNTGAEGGRQTAAELYGKYPSDPAIVSTYALSLLLRDRASEALSALERLPSTARESEAIALYYALILAKTGDTQHANEALAHVHREQLLPEEEALLKQAKL